MCEACAMFLVRLSMFLQASSISCCLQERNQLNISSVARSLSLSVYFGLRLRSGSLLHTSRSHRISLYRSHTLLLSPTIIGLVSVAPRNARHMFNAQLFWSCCAFSTVHSSARVSHCIRQFFWLLLLRCCFAFVLKAKWSKSRCRLKLATCNK